MAPPFGLGRCRGTAKGRFLNPEDAGYRRGPSLRMTKPMRASIKIDTMISPTRRASSCAEGSAGWCSSCWLVDRHLPTDRAERQSQKYRVSGMARSFSVSSTRRSLVFVTDLLRSRRCGTGANAGELVHRSVQATVDVDGVESSFELLHAHRYGGTFWQRRGARAARGVHVARGASRYGQQQPRQDASRRHAALTEEPRHPFRGRGVPRPP